MEASNKMSGELAVDYVQFLNMKMSRDGYSTAFERLNADRIHLMLYGWRNIIQRNVCSLLELFPNNIYKNRKAGNVDFDLMKLNNLDSKSFLSVLDKKDALLNEKLQSRLNKDHKVIKQKKRL